MLTASLLREACRKVNQEGADIARQAYLLAGTRALRDGPIQEAFRDLHAGTQHYFASPAAAIEFASNLLTKGRNWMSPAGSLGQGAYPGSEGRTSRRPRSPGAGNPPLWWKVSTQSNIGQPSRSLVRQVSSCGSIGRPRSNVDKDDPKWKMATGS